MMTLDSRPPDRSPMKQSRHAVFVGRQEALAELTANLNVTRHADSRRTLGA